MLPSSAQDGGQAGVQVLGWQSFETGARKTLQAADHKSHDHGSAYLRVYRGGGGTTCNSGIAQALFEAGFQLVKKLVHALLQAVVFEHQASPTITRVMPGFFSPN